MGQSFVQSSIMCHVLQNLANSLGADVLAPNKFLWVFSDGSLVVAGSFDQATGVFSDVGEFVLVTPGVP